MKTYLYISILLLGFTACKKDIDYTEPEQLTINDSLPELLENDYTEIIHNSYFPLDSNDLWIYRNHWEKCGDVFPITCDTGSQEIQVFIKGNRIDHGYEAKRLGRTYYNSQDDRISIIIFPETWSCEHIQVLDILYTNAADTSWTINLCHETGFYSKIDIEQKKHLIIEDNLIQDYFEISLHPYTELGRKFIFQKDVGITHRQINVPGLDDFYDLLEYIDN